MWRVLLRGNERRELRREEEEEQRKRKKWEMRENGSAEVTSWEQREPINTQ